MTLNFWLLRGIQAAGEILSSLGRLLAMSLYLIILAKPCCTLLCVLSHNTCRASFVLADRCGPCAIAASMQSFVHGSPQSTGHPFSAYVCRSGASGWFIAYVHGHISPFLPILSLIGRSSGIVVSFLIASFVAC